MSDDLLLLITFLSTDNSMVKVAICIPGGLSNRLFDDYEYFHEPEVERRLKGEMNMHVAVFCKKILAVEILFDIKGKNI